MQAHYMLIWDYYFQNGLHQLYLYLIFYCIIYNQVYHKCEFQSSSAICTVIKDGGDDPDVTHGAEIVTKISLEGEPEQIRIQGGKGVGKVTKPGLGLEIGKHAINPVPKKMIEQSVREIGKEMLHVLRLDHHLHL